MSKITEDFLKSEIERVDYTRLSDTLTHCAITVKSGFVFTGESVCDKPEHYQENSANYYAYREAFKKMWLPYFFWEKQKDGNNFAYRLNNERDELAERTKKLGAFLQAHNFGQLSEQQRELLREQYTKMTELLDILNKRIELL